MSEEIDDAETQACAACGIATPIEDLSHHGDDYDLCEVCSAALIARIKSCDHVWDADLISDDMGDVGHQCSKCGWFKVEAT